MINPKPILAIAASALLGALAMTSWRSVYGKQGIKPAEKPSEHIVNICQLHHRLLAAYPTQKPTTFFQHLGLDHNEAPFTDPRWLIPGEAANDKAHDIINKKWAEREQRLLNSARESEEEQALYSRVAEAMQDHQLMAVYMDQFMPELVKSQEGFKWLKKTCGKDWKEEN
ncbi:hypothetical protein CEP54_014943 [Fusarium duplospermum]|uniref:Uncharacterized protein n=1 Tax=Fusarium duplospermum TaxID=1325734 RepID=A0A428NSQ7_9HYPO|nr:hypothetical protein CEP54_014943 [Fusarium duplospermum]